MNVYSGIIHNSQKLEKTQTSINWWMDKQIVVHPYNRYHPIIKMNKPLTPAITSMNFKSVMLNERNLGQEVTFCIIPFIGHSGKGKTIWKKIRSVVVMVWGCQERINCKMPTVTELFYILIVVVLLHIHVKIHQIIYLERMNFTECKLYLHKLDLNCLAFHW